MRASAPCGPCEAEVSRGGCPATTAYWAGWPLLAGGVLLAGAAVLPAAGAAVLPAAGAAAGVLAAGALVAAGGAAAGAVADSEDGCLAQAVNSTAAASALRATFVFIDGTPVE